jgi:hypothetical protein
LSIGIFDLEFPCFLIILFKANGNVYSQVGHFLGKLTIFSFDQLRSRDFHAISCLVRFIGSKHKFDLFINGWKNL